jgi:hypothetical protein
MTGIRLTATAAEELLAFLCQTISPSACVPLISSKHRRMIADELLDADHFCIMKMPASLCSESDRHGPGMLIVIIPES